MLPFNGSRLKSTLKMAISKLKFLQQKKLALGKQQRRQLADLLALGKETSATIRVENIIREDIYVELLEYLELYCELLLARLSLILDLSRTEVDPGLQEAVASVIYCCSHVEVKEVASLGDMLKVRYGADYSRRVLEGADGVSEKVVKRCGIEPPSSDLVVMYLTEIARTYEVPYSQDGREIVGESGEKLGDKLEEKSGELGDRESGDRGSGDGESGDRGSGDGKSRKLGKDQKDIQGGSDVNGESGRGGVTEGRKELSDFDKLKERFAALKR